MWRLRTRSGGPSVHSAWRSSRTARSCAPRVGSRGPRESSTGSTGSTLAFTASRQPWWRTPRRTPQTARSRRLREDSESFLTVTHPFHPLAGQRLGVVFERHYKVTGLSLCCEGGPAGTVRLAGAWTDRGKPAGLRALGYEELVELAGLVYVLTTRQQD